MPRNTFLLLLAGLLIAFFLQLRPIDDVDVFWQVRTGELMLETGQLVRHDVFTYTHAGEPVPPISWLAQLLFAVQHRMAGWPFVRFGTALALAAALVVAVAPARLQVSSFSLTAALALGLLVILPHSSVRPQAFGTLGFAVLLTLGRDERLGWRELLLAVPLLLLWQNLHPSVMVGALVLGVVVAGRWWLFLRGHRPVPPWPLTVLVFLAAASQFATPLGWDLLAVTRQNAIVSRDWLRVSEWLPPWDASVRDAVLTFWLALAISFVLLFRIRFRVPFEEIAIFVSVTLLALSAARFGLFWAIALVPCWAGWLEAAKPADLFPSKLGAKVPGAVAVTVLVVACFLVWAAPRAWPVPLFSRELPGNGVARLEEVAPAGRIYNYREWGGELISQYPRWQVAMDGRLYLFSREEWDEYHWAAVGEIPLHELVERHRPAAFFLRPGFHAGLIARLQESPDWQEAYSDATCAVFKPAAPP